VNDVDSALAQALQLGEEGNWAEMAQLLGVALRDSPDDPMVLCWLGVAERELGRARDAVEKRAFNGRFVVGELEFPGAENGNGGTTGHKFVLTLDYTDDTDAGKAYPSIHEISFPTRAVAGRGFSDTGASGAARKTPP
jgi:hypothetical protein